MLDPQLMEEWFYSRITLVQWLHITAKAWYDDLDPHEIDAISRYYQEGARLNNALRHGDPLSSTGWASLVSLLDSAILKTRPTPRSFTVYRGFRTDRKPRIGDRTVVPSFLSSSVSPLSAKRFAEMPDGGPVHVEASITIPRGMHIACLFCIIEDPLGEQEVLLQRNLHIHITRVTHAHGVARYYFVDMEATE